MIMLAWLIVVKSTVRVCTTEVLTSFGKGEIVVLSLADFPEGIWIVDLSLAGVEYTEELKSFGGGKVDVLSLSETV